MSLDVWRSLLAAHHRVALRVSMTAAVGSLGLSGCHDLISVDAPDVIQSGDYATTAGATALAAGAITQFHIVFGGGSSSNQVGLSGLMADELFATTSVFPAAVTFWDSRNAQDPALATSPYLDLHIARQQLLTAISRFQRVAPDSSARVGQLFALLGYTSVFFGEDFCAGVPLSRRDESLRPIFGQPLTSTQLFDSALAAFDSALVYGVDSARIANLARVGRGRALLNEGRFSEAAQAVANVPTTYVYNVTYLNVTGLENGLSFVPPSGSARRDVTVPESEGTNGINWRSAGDPRVPLINRSPGVIGLDNVTQVWGFTTYQATNAPVRLAGGIEARLIEAEAALQAGDASSWLATLNALRATVSGLAPVADPGTGAGRVDLHFSERAFWLFLTGHRHGDLRRLVRQYGRAAETVFPTGQWRDGIPYGSAINVAPPGQQLNNPHYSGCLNRDT